jgi:hypothetical protein
MKVPCVIVLALLSMALPLLAQTPAQGLREDFNTLADWKPLTFPKIPRHSVYAIEKDGANGVLVASADRSASGIVHVRTFSISRTPVIRWRWKVSNVYSNGDEKRKSGDDYALRVYVVFQYDPKKAGVLERAQYSAARLIYGEYPPQSSLNYIWANRNYPERILPNPYTARAQMVLLQKGEGRAGQWVEEKVNALDDYRTAFGKDPPDRASLAIMSDADDTGEKATGYIDYIEVADK